jgi:hypothetical protein
MTTHMLRTTDRDEYTTRCGQTFSKKAKRDADHHATVWESEVTCTRCGVSAQEILVGPLALSKQMLDNNQVQQVEQPLNTNTQKETNTMARDKSPETEVTEEATPVTEPAATTEAAAPAKAKKVKADVPEGWVTPVAFAHALNARDKENGLPGETRPQIIYGYVKNSKTFPHKLNTDGAVIVHRDDAFKYIDELRSRKATREQEKAAKAAVPAASETPAAVSV